jgi:hypothetical protein
VSELVGALVALIAAFAGAWYGGRLQRTSGREQLSLSFQIDYAAKFIASVADFFVAYGLAWAPGTQALTMEERQAPLLAAVMDLRARAAAIEIAGPDELAAGAADILFLAADRGLRPSMDVPLLTDLAMGLDDFKVGAKSLRPVGQKNGRNWGPRWLPWNNSTKEIPGH